MKWKIKNTKEQKSKVREHPSSTHHDKNTTQPRQTETPTSTTIVVLLPTRCGDRCLRPSNEMLCESIQILLQFFHERHQSNCFSFVLFGSHCWIGEQHFQLLCFSWLVSAKHFCVEQRCRVYHHQCQVEVIHQMLFWILIIMIYSNVIDIDC